jgi:hypothetical protein
MTTHGHTFRQFGQVEKICRCGFVIPHDATEKEVENLMREHLGYVPECSGEWHVFPAPKTLKE